MIPAKYYAENNKLFPEKVTTIPESGDYEVGKIFIDTAGSTIKIVTAVAADGTLTYAVFQLTADTLTMYPEKVAAFPAKGAYNVGKVFFDTAGTTVKMVVAVAEDGTLTFATLAAPAD